VTVCDVNNWRVETLESSTKTRSLFKYFRMRIFEVASLQMTDLRRSLYCHGNYTLVEPFSRFQMPHTAWQVKTSEEKESLFDDFLAFTPTGKCAKTVTSSDGVVTMPATPRIARKPGQRKRPRAERARTERYSHIHRTFLHRSFSGPPLYPEEDNITFGDQSMSIKYLYKQKCIHSYVNTRIGPIVVQNLLGYT